jgi:hypothetical protein
MIDGRKVIQVTLGYAPAEMFVATRTELADKWTPGLIDEKWLTLNKYPLPSVEENEAALIEAAERFGYKTWNPGADLGAAPCVNAFFAANPQPPGTIEIGIDPDAYTGDAGFDLALCEVIAANASMPLCALGIPELSSDDPHVETIAGHRVFRHPSMMMFNIGACDLDTFPHWSQPASYWGGIEQGVYQRLQETGQQLGYLMDYREDFRFRDSHDPRYAAWKWENYYGRFPGSFAEYLEVEQST